MLNLNGINFPLLQYQKLVHKIIPETFHLWEYLMLHATRNGNLLKHCVYFEELFQISNWANHFSEAKNIIVWGDKKDKGPRAEHQPLKYKVSFCKCKVLASFKLSWQTQLQQLYSHSELKSKWVEGGMGEGGEGTKKF